MGDRFSSFSLLLHRFLLRRLSAPDGVGQQALYRHNPRARVGWPPAHVDPVPAVVALLKARPVRMSPKHVGRFVDKKFEGPAAVLDKTWKLTGRRVVRTAVGVPGAQPACLLPVRNLSPLHPLVGSTPRLRAYRQKAQVGRC